ncbi:MAG: energy-dependent translational throttle protein EttA [Candidatus Marinimicrobia bacterium]|nr:energy-dependent translational throttle protein EttA [Candidatus Neomarinimicrobiota bacterium]
MAGEYVFTVQQLTKQHDRKTVLDDVTLAFFHGAKIGVIGGNGAGKSSLLRVLAGQDREYMGTVYLAPRVRVGYLPQEPRLDGKRTVREIVAEGVADAQALLDRYDALCERLGESLSAAEQESVGDEMGRLQDLIEQRDLWELDHQVDMAHEALRLPPPEMRVGVLSGGEQRRVALARLLLSNPDALLLDEPTNHLDAESVAWLEEYLKRFAGTLLVVTHDRYFLNNVTEWILELDRGRAFPYQGNYERWLDQKQSVLDRENKAMDSRRRLLEQELAWVRMNPGGRRARNKARLERYEQLAAQNLAVREDDLAIQIPPGPRLGDLVVRAEGLAKSLGGRLLFDGLDFDLPRGGIVGVIGGNGAGKTTLLRMLMGQEQPDAGRLLLGETVVMSYVDQTRDALNAAATVYEEITGGEETVDLGGRRLNGRAYCARFNFRGGDQQQLVGALSGGERNRVHLAKLLKRGANLLLLDEPTNDLDVGTLRALEEALAQFGGCAVVVSHDRWFLDRIATHILAFEGDSQVTWFEGNYEAYHEHRRALLGPEADRPHRLRFRPVAGR